MNTLADSFYCPETGEKLEYKEGEFFTSKTSYPIFNEIPWLFKNPEFHFLEWGTKIEYFIAAEERTLAYMDLLTQGEQFKLAKKRMVKIIEAKQKNLAVFKKYLVDFLGHKQISLTPSNQQIQSYFQLIFRDWCWETDENEKYFDFIKRNAPKNPRKILILGAGASGLSYKVAQHYASSQVYSTDHNPFLLFIAANIFKGLETKLSDYSFYPINLASTTKHWHVKQEALKSDNHQFVLANFPNLPFEKESFDLIIAPWFLDILEIDYLSAISAAKKYLSPTGSFISIGPANVHSKKIFNQYCSDEQINCFQEHFESTESEQFTTPYLDNPINSQTRVEEVLCLMGSKKKEINTSEKPNHKQGLIKYSDSLQEYKMINDTLNKILKLIENDITQEDLAKKVQVEFKIPEQEALFYTELFMKKIESEL